MASIVAQARTMSVTHETFAAWSVMVATQASAARQTRRGKRVQIRLPVFRLMVTEIVEHAPRKQTGRMAVVEAQQHRVIANRLDRVDIHVRLAGHEHLLAASVALHLGARRMHAQVFGWETECFAAVERDFKHVRGAMQDDAGRLRGLHVRSRLWWERRKPRCSSDICKEDRGFRRSYSGKRRGF